MKVFSKILSLLCLAFFSILPGYAQKNAVYTMFLEQAVPGDGVTVQFNAPVLRWPYQKGKQVKYDVQLSQHIDFPATSTITATALTGAFFNPHQSLQPGKWYWRYRVSGKPWSKRYQFLVPANALPMVSPRAALFLSKVPAAHPRILLDDPHEDITPLSRNADALAIIADADKALLQPALTEADAVPTAKGATPKQEKKIQQDAVVRLGNRVHQEVISLCQAYLLTKNEQYISRAIETGMELTRWNAEGMSGSSDFMDGMCMYNMALVFDTYFDKLSAAQKSALLQAITVRAGRFYSNWVNNIESKVLSGHVWQLLLNEFFKTSIALYHHQPEAVTWLAYAYELFLARAPVLGGLDGGWAEGASYFQMNMEVLTDIPAKINSYTGFDFIRTHPWYQQQANWLIYHVPPGSSADGYGDNTEELFEPPASYAAFADVMARLTQNPKYSWYVLKIQEYQQIHLPNERRMRWFRLTHAEKQKMPTVPDTLQFPMGHLSKETGVASLHTDPANTKNDIVVTMRSSPFGAYGHILADQNTFNILCGGKRLFYRTGYKVAMDDPHRLGWSKHTKSQNGILINGEGQPYSAEAYGNLSRFLQGAHMAYVKGDASAAYQSAETKEDYGVITFYRHVALLKPGIIVIYDELEARSDASWSWLIHSIEDMKLDSSNNTFISTIENAKGIGKLWSSQEFSWFISNTFDVPAQNFRNNPGALTKKYEDTQWHLKAVNRNKARKIRFLSVIQVATDGNILTHEDIPGSEGVTKIKIGDWEIEATLSTTLPAQLKIASLTQHTAFAAYGPEVKLDGQSYKGKRTENSILAEQVNGKMKWYETGDVPIAPIR